MLAKWDARREWVSWVVAFDGKSFVNGHYHLTQQDAIAEFNQRIKKGF